MSQNSAAVLMKQIDEAVSFIRQKHSDPPQVGIILGTGMGELASAMESPSVIDYGDIPNFPVSTVESHSGKLFMGRLGGKSCMMMQGRFHYYEGYSMQQIALPIRVMKKLGAKILVVMNAVGSVNPDIAPGSLVLVTDHINLMGDNPLIGPNLDEMGPRFPDMSQPYDRELIKLASNCAAAEDLTGVTHGVMVAVTGPNLETAAEYRFFQRAGADIVTMSTVPEVLTAVHCGLRTLCISTVTDQCNPDDLKLCKLEEIIAVANATQPKLNKLVTALVQRLPV